MIDDFNRKIDYLRLSVTDRCNLRCTYCMPAEGIRMLDRAQLLSAEEIIKTVGILSRLGFRKIRLTGGEPLVRKDIITIIEGIKAIGPIEDISITTNGVLLKRFLKDLYRLGTKRINISIDSLDENNYSRITRGGLLGKVLEALDESIMMGFGPIKINTVITSGFNLDDARSFIEMSEKKPVFIRFIERMHIPGLETGSYQKESGIKQVNLDDIFRFMTSRALYRRIKGPQGFGPAAYYRKSGSTGSIGFIKISKDRCKRCNRIRLTSRGTLKRCLFSGKELDIKKELRKGRGPDTIIKMVSEYIKGKPDYRDHTNIQDSMNMIGG